MATRTGPPPKLRSIQGDQQAERASAPWATQDEVDAYVENAPDGDLTCRARHRHFYPVTRRNTPLVFEGVTDDGLMIRRVRCVHTDATGNVVGCGKVSRIELWAVHYTKGAKPKITSCELVSSKPGDYDPTYLAKPGQGRMKPKMVGNSIATAGLRGQPYREVRAQAIEAGKARITARINAAAETADAAGASA